MGNWAGREGSELVGSASQFAAFTARLRPLSAGQHRINTTATIQITLHCAVFGCHTRDMLTNACRLQALLDTPVGNKPYQRHQRVQSAGDPGMNKQSHGNCDGIERKGEVALCVIPDCSGEFGVWALLLDDASLKDPVSPTRH